MSRQFSMITMPLFRISNRPKPAIDVSTRPYSPAYIGGSFILAVHGSDSALRLEVKKTDACKKPFHGKRPFHWCICCAEIQW
jgi:hypothetical protein